MITVMSTTSLETTNANANATTKLELEGYNSFKIWLEGYNSSATKKTYTIHLSLFCKHYNINPDSLIQLKSELIKVSGEREDFWI
jgi:hypothetical protein